VRTTPSLVDIPDVEENDNIFSRIHSYDDTPALIGKQSAVVTFDDLCAWSTNILPYMEGRHLTLIICNNHIDVVSAYVTCIRANIPVILLHESIVDEFLEEILERFKPRYLFFPSKRELPTAVEVMNQVGMYSLGRCYDDTDYVIDRNLALLLTTSGSTGSIKFVRISHDNLLANTADIARTLLIDKCDRTITMMPMSYTYGLSVINTHLFSGASIVVDECSIVSKEFFQHIESHDVSTLNGVPFTYETLIRLKFWKKLPKSLRRMTQAGGKLKLKEFEKISDICAELDIDFYSMYGQTEATARMSILDSGMAVEKKGSIGLAIGNGEFELRGADGERILEPNIIGSLTYVGGNVTYGYATGWQDLAELGDAPSMLDTGDVAYFDAEGYYYIVGREKRFVKIHGNRVSLDEIEAILSGMGVENAVLGKDDEIRVFIPERQLDVDVFKVLSKKTKIPRRIFQVFDRNDIPRLQSGKVDYQTLASCG